METEDPAALYANPRGAIQPLGGAVGYRGTALAILVEVLAALLAKDETDDPARKGSNLAMIAIAAAAVFAERARRMADYVRDCPPIDAARPVMIPGEREHANQRRLGEGPIAVDRPTWKAMCAAAAGLGFGFAARTTTSGSCTCATAVTIRQVIASNAKPASNHAQNTRGGEELAR